MGTFQPLYYSGGRYSSSTDRKLLAALIDAESDGRRVAGVIAAGTGNASMKVTASANQVSVAPGLCVIPDATAATLNTGLYLAGVLNSAETAAFPTNGSGQRTHIVYAVVDDTPFTVTNKKTDTNVVTLTTSGVHGFMVGQTVVVSGVDDFYDGQYQIADVPTTTTFTYAKSGVDETPAVGVYPEVRIGANWAAVTAFSISSNTVTLTLSTTAGLFSGSLNTNEIAVVKGVSTIIDGAYKLSTASSSQAIFSLNKRVSNASGSVTNSSIAVARVPFKIVVELEGGTVYTSKTKIELATITLPSGADTPSVVTDKRVFASASGGVHMFNTGTSLGNAAGRLRYNIAENRLQYYTTSWNNLLELDATQTDATKAALGNHGHSQYTVTGHTHSEYIGVTHTTSTTAVHTIDQITGIPGNIPLPVSAGVGNSSGISLTSTTNWSNIPSNNITVNITCSAPVYALVEYSASVVPSLSGTTYYVGVNLSGVTNAPPIPTSYGLSGAHQTSSTDGTAIGDADLLVYIGGTVGSATYGIKNSSRVVRLATGTTTLTMQYRTTGSTSGANLFYPVLRVIPLVFD